MALRWKIGIALSILWCVLIGAISITEHLEYKQFEARLANCPPIRTAADLATCDLSYIDGPGPMSARQTLALALFPLATGWLLALAVAGIAKRVRPGSSGGA